MDDLTGRNIFITGANTGIGAATARQLARRGAHVILACRSREKTQPVLNEIAGDGGSAEFAQLDLAELADVRRAAEAELQRDRPLHVLINNAGLAGKRGLTRDGFELTFGTNHLGHFLLTTLLLPRLRAAAPARIVNVSSKAHYRTKAIDWAALKQPGRSGSGLNEYGVSKLCNVLFTKELARSRAGAGVHSYALHPGVIASDVWRQVPWPIRPIITAFMRSVDEGARTSVYCATSPDVAEHDGRYYDDCRELAPSALADDAALARELWERSAAWVAAGADASAA